MRTRTRTLWVSASAGLTEATTDARTTLLVTIPFSWKQKNTPLLVGGAANSPAEPTGSTRTVTTAKACGPSMWRVASKMMLTR